VYKKRTPMGELSLGVGGIENGESRIKFKEISFSESQL